jgi:hypothetical protein
LSFAAFEMKMPKKPLKVQFMAEGRS